MAMVFADPKPVTGSIPGCSVSAGGSVRARWQIGYCPDMTDGPSKQSASRMVQYPSAEVPGIPRFVFSVPAHWEIDEAPSALCVIRRQQDDGGFWVNAIIRHDKLPRSVDFERAAKVTWAKLKRTNPEATSNGERLMRCGSNVVYVRGVDLAAPDGKPLAQMQAMFFAPVAEGGVVVDFFQLIGTSRRDETVGENMKAFAEMIASFRFV